MSKPNTGGPAFPTKLPPVDDLTASFQHTGMALRDWFAGQAAKGSCYFMRPWEAGTPARVAAFSPPTYWSPEEIATRAYEIADAMLEERNKS